MVQRLLLTIFFCLFALICVLAFPFEHGEEHSLEKRKISDFQKWLESQKKKEKEKKKHTSGKVKKFVASNGGGGWNENYKKIKNIHKADGKFLKLDKDDKKSRYPKHLKDKLKRGERIKQYEEDKFENEYGRFRQRNRTSALDIIASVNQANDITDVHEGDITKNAPNFDYRTKRSLGSEESGWERRKRDTRRDRVYLWLNRVVPYEIDYSLSESTDIIRSALKKIEDKSCIRFKVHENEDNWIKFVKKSGCYSSVGKNFWTTGSQDISLGTNCVYDGIIMHEVLHALGFWHEQSRPDRDQYVKIFWENIVEDELHNFNKYSKEAASVLNAPYDFGSIMHYGKYSFAINSEKPTILSVANPEAEMGQRNEMSATDIFQLNALYDCSNGGTGWSSWSEYGPCDTNCKKEQTRFCMHPTDKTACPNPLDPNLSIWGVDVKESECPHAECYASVDGHWNRWGAYSDCSVSCDKGIQTRTRECTDPAPKNGGKYCEGESTSSRECEKRSCSSGPNDCAFEIAEEPFCAWTNDASDDFNWKRHSGSTPSSSTGPSGDHTSGSGYYLFIETSAPAKQGWKARLLSKEMNSGTRCMSFAYSMYGVATGSLHVYTKDMVTQKLTEVFSKSGDQLKGWNTEEFDIYESSRYQVIIEAIRGSSFQGDIGIDDITIKDGSCSGVVSTPAPVVPTVKRVGCYNSKGYIDGKRIFSQYKNFREKIVWKDLNATLTEIIGLCSAFARDNNYEYFGIEYWGECWTGPNDEINYGRDGECDNCWPLSSDNLGPPLVGTTLNAMVYKWV